MGSAMAVYQPREAHWTFYWASPLPIPGDSVNIQTAHSCKVDWVTVTGSYKDHLAERCGWCVCVCGSLGFHWHRPPSHASQSSTNQTVGTWWHFFFMALTRREPRPQDLRINFLLCLKGNMSQAAAPLQAAVTIGAAEVQSYQYSLAIQ